MKFATIAAVLPLISFAAAAPGSPMRRYGYEASKGDEKHYGDDGKGEWKDDGKKHYEADKGEWRDDGKKHEGEWKDDGKKHYEGEWKDDGKKHYEGEWKDDGKKHYEADKGEWKYDGKHYDDGKHYGDDRKDKYFKTYPFEFTSTAVAYATPDTIVNNSQVAVPGLEGGWGTFALGLNSVQDVICYNISVYIRGNYSSPAVTATHIHEAAAGAAGPPRIAFPNPQLLDPSTSLDEFAWRGSFGCIKGPFFTGLNMTNTTTDQGAGFTIAKLESNLEGFFADTHTSEFPAGAIRGQLEWKKAY